MGQQLSRGATIANKVSKEAQVARAAFQETPAVPPLQATVPHDKPAGPPVDPPSSENPATPKKPRRKFPSKPLAPTPEELEHIQRASLAMKQVQDLSDKGGKPLMQMKSFRVPPHRLKQPQLEAIFARYQVSPNPSTAEQLAKEFGKASTFQEILLAG